MNREFLEVIRLIKHYFGDFSPRHLALAMINDLENKIEKEENKDKRGYDNLFSLRDDLDNWIDLKNKLEGDEDDEDDEY